MELDLSQNRLSGHIPWEIGTKLANLQFFGAWGNQLKGNIPNSIGNCSNLTILYLDHNQLSGMVPVELGKLNLITWLYLSHNQLVSTTSSTLAFLTALTNCSHLEELDVSFNNLTGVLPLSIDQLSSNLSLLRLSDNMISGRIPQQIANLTNLALLNLSRNIFSGNIPSGIKAFHKLERLYMDGNKLEGSIPNEIGRMQSLGLLSLSHNHLSGKIPDSLCSSGQLRYLYLQHNNLSGEIPVSLEGCQKLELLDFSYNKLEGRIPREVTASLKNLQLYLNLSWNSLHGSLPQEMSQIVMAQAIDISGNRLTGVIPNALGSCTALEQLNLSHNAFEGPIPDSLSKLKNLQEMDLSFNNLSGQIPKGGLFPNRTFIILFMGNLGLCGPKNYSLPPCPNQTQEKQSVLKKIVLSVVGTIAFILCSFIIGMLWRQKNSRQLFPPSNFIFQRLSYPKFSYQDLVIATSGFDEANLLGVGNFGSVYKGILRDGKIVAIKILNLHNEEAHKSFNTECKVLGRIRHRNLIRVISAFFYPALKGLVLQFASKGSLEKYLHRDRDDPEFCELGLSECLSIAIDVAHGMEYLHHDCPLQLVHCDLKPSNVLLDANMTALVTDFGISRLAIQNSTDSLTTTTFALRGSIGYIAPEYGLGGCVSTKGDVYSYGILILEMITRKRPSDDMFVGDINLTKWVSSAFPNRLADIVDSRLLRDVNANMEENRILPSFIHLGLLCTNESPRERPSMRDVTKAMESLKASFTGNAVASNLTSTISDLLRNTNLSVPDSQSSSF
ncbi:putative leucine-rich repeat receptor-like serine/threonine-protein kinase At2g24130 [Cryptomeria japonica]|uniref:putative leucine-rich repeat receptor-like serine/threonine-protein kinase At2g24130 n=1 Tax=Cryptomeria japonica TaxID=3369 RepID=UPI0025AD4172|nr:putative leucine-rich repeat receptor-like serine/threonine-protein kinase At2g24130 [Cryptomeria japonica]